MFDDIGTNRYIRHTVLIGNTFLSANSSELIQSTS